MREEKARSDNDIIVLFEKLFPFNHNEFPPIINLARIAYKTFEKIKSKEVSDLQTFMEDERELDLKYLGPFTKAASISRFSISSNSVNEISIELISNGLISEIEAKLEKL